MKDKLLEVSALVYEVNENTDHDVMLTITKRSVRIVVWLNGFSETKQSITLSGRVDDASVRSNVVEKSLDDIILELEDLLDASI